MEYDHFEFQNALTNFAKSSKNEPYYLMSVKLFVNGVDIVTDEYIIDHEILRRTLDQDEMELVYSNAYGDHDDFVPQISSEYELPIITCTCFHAECLGIDYIKIVHFDNYIQWIVPYPLSEWKLSKSYRELLDAGERAHLPYIQI